MKRNRRMRRGPSPNAGAGHSRSHRTFRCTAASVANGLAMPSRIAPAFRRTMRHFEPAGVSMTFPLSVTASRARKWASTSLARTGRTRSHPLRAGARHRHRMPPGRPLLVVGERSPMATCKGCPGGLRAAHDRPRWPSRAGGLLSPRISEIRPTTRAYRISSRNSRYSTSNRRRFAHA